MKNINRVIIIVVFIFFIIGVYHLLAIILKDNEIVKSIYHISYNLIILSLMYHLRGVIEKVVYMKKIRKIIVILSLYFIYKVILNIAYMFGSFRDFASNYNTDIWGLILSTFILVSLIGIKFQNND